MGNIKTVIGLVATSLVFIGYIPYFRDIVNRKTKPHIYSWFIWSLVTMIVFALQISNSAGTASFATLAASIMCLTVLVLGAIYKSKVKITKIDTIFFVMSLLSLGFWLVAKEPIISSILITIVNFLGFIPTMRKSWEKPFTETLFLYYFNAFRYSLTVFSLQRYSIITALYVVTCLTTTVIFIAMVNLRRRQFAFTSSQLK